jgi:hypothetical protein
VFVVLPAAKEVSSVPIHTTKEPHCQYRRSNYILEQEICLVDVRPGISSDPVRCQMLHVKLKDDHAYEAVSYTWADKRGDDRNSKTVCFPHTTMLISVTFNCEAALRQLRKPGNPRRVWIDAICLDQTNVHKRNHQINMMAEVFLKA